MLWNYSDIYIMVRIAICMCGFNKNNILNVNIRDALTQNYFNDIEILDMYYFTYMLYIKICFYWILIYFF